MKTKRHRGGQPGNRNAVKHGLYSVNLCPGDIWEFWNNINLGGADPDLVAFRMKLSSALQYHPGSYRVIREASRLLSKWSRSKCCLDNEDYAEFKKVVRGILKTIGDSTCTFCRSELVSTQAKPPVEFCRYDSYLDGETSAKNAETDRS